jgi:branched-subunit amino acid aminotransferase/4-amino-4-deoxychorismate lyase
VRIARPRLNNTDPFAGHKTLNYWPRLKELQDAAREGYAESLWFDLQGSLACGCTSNVFVVKDGVLKTPWARGEADETGERAHPVLPGVTRGAILEAAVEKGRPFERCRISGKDLLEADEVFLTNSVWDVIPVRDVAGRMLTRSGDLWRCALDLPSAPPPSERRPASP